MKISPELWQQLDPLLTDALEMEDGTRAEWLRALEKTHPALTPTLCKMLAAHERAERAQEMETVPRLAPAPQHSSVFAMGTRVGPFALLRLLGRGGMGEVWLANQVDGRIEREIALKLPTVYLHSDVWRERFHRERDILAKLTHPNIARLFDAGVSEEEGSRGQPYLAMENIEGESLTRFVSTRQSTIAARLNLFRQILAAVAHAHRHLVVHRDLKPANILIDTTGQVKLLDFGIAKLVDDGTAGNAAADLTQLGGRVMTLRYAAPEQVSADFISTATDSYALGVILHELVTGLSPYRAVREGRALTETALLNDETAVPSMLSMTSDAAAERKCASTKTLSRQVAGDLDAIILKAMRKNPADRYASIEQFDDDIQRHLDSRPVGAREGTWRYLAGRFAARYKLPVLAAAAVLVTVAAGVVLVERQRRVAVAQKERAERHFDSIRKLANSLMFDVHDQIINLPGATPAKKVLVENASKYLVQLANEAGDDPVFRRELADAYLRLGNIQGQYGSQNVGKPEEALQSYDQAVALLLPMSEYGTPKFDAVVAEALIRVHRQRSLVLSSIDRVAEANDAARAGLAIAEKVTAKPDANVQLRLLHAYMMVELSQLSTGSGSQAIRLRGFEQGIELVNEILRSLPADAPADVRENALTALAWMDSGLGNALRWDKSPAIKRRAVQIFHEALSIREDALRRVPTDVSTRRAIVANQTAIGLTLGALGEDREALAYMAKGVATMQTMLAEDPENAQYRQDVFVTLPMLAGAQLKNRKFRETLDTARRGHELYAGIPAVSRDSSALIYNLAGLMRNEGEAQLSLATEAGQRSRRDFRLAEARRLLLEVQRLYAVIDAKAGTIHGLSEEKAEVQHLLGVVEAELQLRGPD